MRGGDPCAVHMGAHAHGAWLRTGRTMRDDRKIRLMEAEREKSADAAWAELGVPWPRWMKERLQEDVDEALSQAVGKIQLSLGGLGLIVTDRLYGWGIALQYFLVKCMGMEAVVATSYGEAQRAMEGKRPELLLYVGYQKNEENDRLIGDLWEDYTSMVLWAIESPATAWVLREHGELMLLDRSLPLNYLACHIEMLHRMTKGARKYYDAKGRRRRRDPVELVRPWGEPGP